MTSRTLDKVWLTGTLLAGLSLLAGDFLLFKPNRLVGGEGVVIWQAEPLLLLGVIALLLLLLSGAVVRPPMLRRGFSLAAPLLLLLLLVLGGRLSSAVLSGEPDFARTSLGSGFWGAVFGLFIVLVHSFKTLFGAWLRIGITVVLLVGVVLIAASGTLNSLSLIQEFFTRESRFYGELLDHLKITFLSVGGSVLLGLPLGLMLIRIKRLERPVFSFLNTVQTIPSLALFGLLIAPLALLSAKFEILQALGITGIGWAPAVIALSLYALLPVVRNTFVGFKSVQADILQAGRGMGMTGKQLLFKVELPLAAPVLLNGIRISSVQTVGNTAVAALIGAGGFGAFIFQGLGQGATDLILLGAIPTVLLAVCFDFLLQGLITVVTPRGLS